MESPLPKAAPDFDHPLDMLEACHERIAERCELLERLAAHVESHGCDEQAAQAAANIVRYFDTAGEHHHEDEEKDVFPHLLASGTPGAAALIARLRSDHTEMRELWKRLRVTLESVAQQKKVPLDATLIERFTAAYRTHIELEETQLFSFARESLDASLLASVGANMAQRRGVKP